MRETFKKNCLIFIYGYALFFSAHTSAIALDYSVDYMTASCSINNSLSGLISNPASYTEATIFSPNPCCLRACIANAQIEGSACKCSPGFYNNSGTCSACPAGSYSNLAFANGTDNCTLCPTGTFNSGTGNTSCPNNCPVGGMSHVATYGPNTWASGNTSVNMCVPATCESGYHVDTAANKCVANTYSIRFDMQGGLPQVPENTNCRYDQPCSWGTVNVTKGGEQFAGWAFEPYAPGMTITQLPALYKHTYGNLPAPVADGSTVIIVYARFYGCPNTTGVPSDGWGPEPCVVTKCNPGYYIANDGLSIGKDYPTYCKPCTTPGIYCPGGTSSNQTVCERGFYCTGVPDDCTGGKCKCPRGSTSSGGNSDISECFMQGGTNGTKLCDSRGCFNLPTTINYN